MEFGELVRSVAKKFPDVKNLEVTVSARRDDKGEFVLTYKADSIYMTGVSGRNPEALLLKIDADRMQTFTIDDVGTISAKPTKEEIPSA